MADKSVKVNTGALDVGAMYQIGAAGAGSKSNNEGLKWLSQIGRFAIGFKMRSIENFKAASTRSNEVFAKLDDQLLTHSLDLNDQTLEEVKSIKQRVTKSNKTMSGIKYSWRLGSDEYKAASEDKTKALLELKKLEKANGILSAEYKDILEISNGERFDERTGKKVSLFGTEEELYYASLMANGTFAAAREWDSEKGEYMINMQLLGDNPDTKGVDESKLGKVALSEFKFARPDNPNLVNPGDTFISKMIKAGAENNFTEGSREFMKKIFGDEMDQLPNRDLAQLLFTNKISIDGEDVLYIDAIVEDRIGTLVEAIGANGVDDDIPNPNYVEDSDDPSEQETIKESELYTLSITGAKETIKNEIINASEGAENKTVESYKEFVKNLVETNADKHYEDEVEKYEANKNSGTERKGRHIYKTMKNIYKKHETAVTNNTINTFTLGPVTWVQSGKGKDSYHQKGIVSKQTWTIQAIYNMNAGDYATEGYWNRIIN